MLHFEIKNLSNGEVEVLLYGEIGGFSWETWRVENGAKEFAEKIAAIKASKIILRINSPGGNVFEGQAMHSALKNHPAEVVAHIDGIAASIASVIAMGADKVIMPENAMMMIHNPWGGVMGDAAEIRKMAETMDKIKESLVSAYQGKTGLSRAKISKLMDEETWMTAKEAKKLGFADEISEEIQAAASLSDGALSLGGVEFKSQMFKNFPKELMKMAKIKAENDAKEDQNATEGLESSASEPAVANSEAEAGEAPVPAPAETSSEQGAEAVPSGEKPAPVPAEAAAPAESAPAPQAAEELTAEFLKAKHPDVFAKVMAMGAQFERERISAIEALGIQGHGALVAKAKFEQAMSPETLAMEVMRAEKDRRAKAMVDRRKDAEALNSVATSGIADVIEDVANAGHDQEIDNKASGIAAGINERRK